MVVVVVHWYAKQVVVKSTVPAELHARREATAHHMVSLLPSPAAQLRPISNYHFPTVCPL